MTSIRFILIALVVALPHAVASEPMPAPPADFWVWHENNRDPQLIADFESNIVFICSYVDDSTSEVLVGMVAPPGKSNNGTNICFIPEHKDCPKYSHSFWLFGPKDPDNYQLSVMPHHAQFPNPPQVVSINKMNQYPTTPDKEDNLLLCIVMDLSNPEETSMDIGLKSSTQVACHVGEHQYTDYHLVFVTDDLENKEFMESMVTHTSQDTNPGPGASFLSFIEGIKFYGKFMRDYLFHIMMEGREHDPNSSGRG